MEPLKVFLDANVMFSAALGGASFQLLWQLAQTRQVILHTSNHCVVEAYENLRRKRPQWLAAFETQKSIVREVADSEELHDWASTLLPEKDVPVLTAAISAGMDVLMTGDLRHFGALMQRNDLQIRVRTVRAFLLSPGQ